MEKLELLKVKYEQACRAAKTLVDILTEPFSIIVRDATIQRFEYTFEAIWKFLKEYLKQKVGVHVHGPKDVFREIFAAGILTEDETFHLNQIVDYRNLTVHTYKEELAQEIYEKILKDGYFLEEVLKRFRDKIK